jgi:Tfp pilus assembly protein PilV
MSARRITMPVKFPPQARHRAPGPAETFRLAQNLKQSSLASRPGRPSPASAQPLSEIRKFQSSRGFTIMEVALAATVLALTLVGMIGVVESGEQMLDLSRKQTIAAQILHGQVDELRLQSWETLSGYSGTTAMSGEGYPAGPTTISWTTDPALILFAANYPHAATIFTVTRTVACVAPVQTNYNTSSNYASTPLLLQVTFTIKWKGVTGRSYSRVTTTLIGSNGLSDVYQRS